MLRKDMTVEEAVMENKDVMPKLADMGIDYNLVAMENLNDALGEKNIDFDRFVEEIEGPNIYKEVEQFRDKSIEEIIKHIVTVIHPYELDMVEQIDSGFRKTIKKYYKERGEQLFVIYEIVLLIKAELVSHFSSEEEFEFKEALKGKEVDFENLIAEHEKTIGLFDRIKVLTHSYNLNTEISEIKELEDKMKTLDTHMRKHIYLENEILFKK
ncbi:iron-sulfur cluster repair protein YtfE (RIC family) [Peptoniphilus olsenii]|uniref:Iron-sulfur cluster repair protein YtfE (RIC family) n=1 Tax=Peptoniphilus olsenii TaxID=411570 RepID=A0ABV2JAR5_9FIRM